MNCKLILLSALLALSIATEGVIVSTAFNNYTCLMNQRRDLVIVRGLLSTGSVDTTALSNINGSNIAGLLTDVYMQICPGKDASTQVNAMIDALNPNKLGSQKHQRLLFEIKQEEDQPTQTVGASIYDGVYGNIWISVDTNSAIGCSWKTKTQAQNCDYVGQVVRAIENRGRSAGIFSNSESWKQIVGSECKNFTNLPLIYSNIGNEDFSDWSKQAFGGWAQPNIKNYFGEVNICGTRFDLLYF